MQSLGTHLLLELRDCRAGILQDLDKVREIMVNAAREAKATVVEVAFHEFNPFGISGMVIIAESHLSIHTWPEYNYAAVDIFTCGEIIVPQEAAHYLIREFGSQSPSMVEMKRGMLSFDGTHLPHKVETEEIRRICLKPKNSKWFLDYLTPEEGHIHGIKKTLYSKKTKFQDMEIMETGSYGRCLILDQKMQSSEVDEFIYHEVLVHPAMLLHPEPKDVFIVGGGEGATLREVLRHKSVEHCLMVDIDEEVVRMSEELLPEYHAGAFDDKRTELAFTDARRWLEENDKKYDVIIIDISEPVEEGPAYLLYTREFYKLVWDRLTDEGTIALQAGTTAIGKLLNLTAVHKTLQTVFPHVVSMPAAIPSFGLPWGFALASKKNDPRALTVDAVDKMIAQRIKGELKYYDGEAHQHLMHLPKYIRKAIIEQSLIIEDNAPIFTYN